MEGRSFQEIVEAALRKMEENGVSAKQLKEYRQTGFGAFRRHFSAIGQTDFSAEAIHSYVTELRSAMDNGCVSAWTWGYVRRGGEILKHFANTGEVKIPALRPWNPLLKRTSQSVEHDDPTTEQLSDPDNLFALIWRVRQELFIKGLAPQSIHHYTCEGFSVILRKHISYGLEHYSETLSTELVTEKRNQYENGKTSRVAYQNLRKAGALLYEMHQTGKVTLSNLPDWGQREPTPEFAKLLSHFCDDVNRTGVLANSTVKTASSAIRGFFFDLESRGITSFKCVTSLEISGGVTQAAKRYSGGLKSALFSIRVFLKHLYANGCTPEDLSLAVPEMASQRKTYREGFTGDEIKGILASPDGTAIGKRDYAIMLLASQTGLRACDVVNLKRADINWRAREIRIVQSKTGKPLSMPLEPESGNAIADYLLHYRPVSDLPYIFLCHPGEKRPINNRSASGIVTKHLKRAKIVSVIPRRGFHSFRRSFGTRMLQNEVPLELLQQLLGHSQIDSLKPYLSVEEQALKNCALGLVIGGQAGGAI
jgi:site-specific recombinase XerD